MATVDETGQSVVTYASVVSDAVALMLEPVNVASDGEAEAEATTGNMQPREAIEAGNKVYSPPSNTVLTGRDDKGRMLPGFTLNPNGRPRKAQELAVLNSISAFMTPEKVRQCLSRALELAEETNSWRGYAAVVELALAYQIGRPTQRVEHSDAASPAEWLQALIGEARVSDGFND